MFPKHWTTYALLLGGMTIFGSGTPVSKIVTDAFPPFLASGLRMLTAALLLSVAAWPQRDRLRNLARHDLRALAVIALVGMFGFSVFMLLGMQRISGVIGSIIMATTPAVTALAAVLFLGNRLSWRKIVAIGLAVAGVLVLQLSRADGVSFSDTLLIGSVLIFLAVCSEATFTLLGGVVSDDLNPVLISFTTSIAALVLFSPLMLYDLTRLDTDAITVRSVLALLWWGAGTLALGTVIWYSGVRRVAGSTAAGFMSVMPVSALVLSYILLGEPFEPVHLLGFGIVLIGILLIASDRQA
ncbi:MAG: DMT family transporter [Anaerolineales bacterium]